MFRRLLLLALVAGCPGGDELPMCITVDATCAPLYTPTFTNVYTMTIRPSCGATNNACHSASSPGGGLSFADEQTAFDGLTRGRVTAGNPGCSEMIVRTHSAGKDYEMPPGAPLSASTQCALLQWVQNGAQR
jgi:hypothetical protein